MSGKIDRTRHVRDLVWAINSPSLIERHAVDRLPELDEEQIDARQLGEFLANRPTNRVGRYFENLVHFYLKHVRRLDLVEVGMQIRKGARTVGEIDFLFRDEAGDLNHWETAVKFFLHSPVAKNGSRLIGPNPEDSYEQKAQRLVAHQLPLGSQLTPRPVVSRALFKGRIHHHAGLPEERRDSITCATLGLSPAHPSGVWLRSTELAILDKQPRTDRYRILAKPYWLAPEIAAADDGDLLSLGQLKAAIDRKQQSSSRPLQFSGLTPENNRYRETFRCFVVSESWPNMD